MNQNPSTRTDPDVEISRAYRAALREAVLEDQIAIHDVARLIQTGPDEDPSGVDGPFAVDFRMPPRGSAMHTRVMAAAFRAAGNLGIADRLRQKLDSPGEAA